MKTVRYGRFSLFANVPKPLYQAGFNVSTILALKAVTRIRSAKTHLFPCARLNHKKPPNPPPQKSESPSI